MAQKAIYIFKVGLLRCRQPW